MRRLAIVLLHLAPNQQVEFLVGAAELDVGLHRHRVVALRQRIEKFVNRDRLVRPVALGEIVALEHARDGVCRGQRIMPAAPSASHPFRIEVDLGLLARRES